MRESVVVLTAKEGLERYAGIIRGYMAFVSALLLVLLANRDKWGFAWLPATLLALSLPSLVALETVEYLYSTHHTQKLEWMRGLAAILGFGPSVVGLCIAVGHTRWFAGVLLGILIAFWLVCLIVCVHERDRATDSEAGRQPQTH